MFHMFEIIDVFWVLGDLAEMVFWRSQNQERPTCTVIIQIYVQCKNHLPRNATVL